MSPLRISLFGVPRFERDGETIVIHRRKAIALLAYLATTGQPHSRDSLSTLFWPENDQSSARANLRRELSRLKQALGDQILDIEREQVGMAPEVELWLDVNEFQEKMDQAQKHGYDQPQLCTECQVVLSEAVALYTGDFMTGFNLPDSTVFDEWQFFQAESLRQLLSEALQRLIGWYSGEGEYERGIEYARRWLSLDPLHEPAHRQLMQLYAWSGQQAAAIRQYQECLRLLEEELGVEPETETTKLYEAIRTRQLTPPVAKGKKHPSPLLAGTEPAPHERYIQEELLSVGSHGEVYRGRDLVSGQPVVIKRLKPELVAQNPNYVARFVREGEILRQLNHPNIVKMLAVLEQEGEHSIVMEYVPGGSLRDLLDEQQQLPQERALDIALELADALARAHHLDIIHRDIKPENVLLAADGTPRLTDFGLARLAHDSARLTQPGAFIGSPAYMSPEALRGERPDARSDIWSFGVLLYEMLAGRPPFDGEQITPIMLNILQEPVPDIVQFRLNVPPMLEDLLQRMLTKEPEKRIASIRQVAAELEAIRSGRASKTGQEQKRSDRDGKHSLQEKINLPSHATPFIGREEELEAIQHLLGDDPACRLLTLLGPGGSGKTRLAVQAASILAEGQSDIFSDGVRFVPLASLRDTKTMDAAIAKALDFSFYAGQEQRHQQLLDYLQPKRMLLLLDNFEHLVNQESVGLVAEILNKAPQVKIVITSRTRLNAQGEHLFPVEGLKTPSLETPVPKENITAEYSAYSAILLFQQDAARVQPGFEITPSNLPDVIRICQLVQGMPLGIELATAWLELLTPAEIVAEIERSLDFLETEWGDLPERQRSLRAVFESSWSLLTEAERKVLKELSVFQGSFTRQAVQAVTGVSLKTLLALCHKSWLQRNDNQHYQIHELLKQYAHEKLQSDPAELQRVKERHSNYYASFLNEQAQVMRGSQQKEAFNAIASEFEDIRAAWHWLVEHGRVETLVQEMLTALFQYCEARAKISEIQQLLHQARQALEARGSETIDQRLLATLLTGQAAFYHNGMPVRYETFGLLVRADEDTLRQAWALAPGQEDLQAMGYWGVMLAYLYGRAIDQEQGIQCLRHLALYFRQEGRRWELAFTLSFLGGLLEVVLAGDPDDEAAQAEAGESLSEALAIYETLGEERERGCTLRALGNLHMLKKDLHQAIDYWREAQEKLRDAGEWAIGSDIDWQIGDAYLRLGQYEQAFRCYQAMRQVYVDMGFKIAVVSRLSKEGYESVRYGDIDHARELQQQSLDLSREIGAVLVEAWSTWEMGEVYRVAGDHTTARQWYDKAKILFDDLQETGGYIFYYRGLGDIAQMVGDYAEAQQRFSESLRYARQANHEWGLVYALCGLGRAETSLGQYEVARDHFSEALRTAQKMGEIALMLVALAGFAGLYAANGELERAVELSTLVINHCTTWKETRAQAEATLKAASALPQEAFTASQERIRGLDMLDAARHLLEVPVGLG